MLHYCCLRLCFVRFSARRWKSTRGVVQSPTANNNAEAVNTSILDFSNRIKRLSELELRSQYPSMSHLKRANVCRGPEFRKRYNGITDDSRDSIALLGRIVNIRYSGKGLAFFDLLTGPSNQDLVQVIANYSQFKGAPDLEHFSERIRFYKKGDYVLFEGNAGLSQSRHKTLSLKCSDFPIMLSLAQWALPPKLANSTKQKHNRTLDYQVNGLDSILLRSIVLKQMRKFLESRGFTEVETPILSSKCNGAAAEPFVTTSRHWENPLSLRVAPELWLKRLIIGGLDRVYEIGRVFRNEGIDATHNPEFTTLEFYQRYLSMSELIEMSEDMFRDILQSVVEAVDKRQISVPAQTLEMYELLRSQGFKFKTVEFLPTLSQEIGCNLDEIDLSCPQAILSAIPAKAQSQLELNNTQSPAQILDKLCGYYIESRHCQGLLPTVIYHFPTALSPLAKTDMENPKITKRFEIFIKGQEYINAYEEENCPQEQLEKFRSQQSLRKDYGDTETLASIDLEYIDSMKWGMPPTGGFGLGIDRLCMLLMGQTRIEKALTFGTLDDVNRQ